MTKLSEVRAIWPEHQTCNDTFKFTSVVSSLLLYVIVSFVPGVGCIKFIVQALLLSCYWRLPNTLERSKMEPFGGCRLEYRSYNGYQRSKREPVDCEPSFVAFGTLLSRGYSNIHSYICLPTIPVEGICWIGHKFTLCFVELSHRHLRIKSR